MKDERIVTIVNEIEYWKAHKILPEQQCDFLLAIYTHGEGTEQIVSKKRMKPMWLKKSAEILQLILLLFLLPFSFLVLYFTELHIYLQLGILALFLSYSFWMFLYFKQRGSIYYHLSLVISLFLVLLFTVLISNIFSDHIWMIYSIIGLNFILWFILGWIYRLKYLLITSTLGLLFVILNIFDIISL